MRRHALGEGAGAGKCVYIAFHFRFVTVSFRLPACLLLYGNCFLLLRCTTLSPHHTPPTAACRPPSRRWAASRHPLLLLRCRPRAAWPRPAHGTQLPAPWATTAASRVPPACIRRAAVGARGCGSARAHTHLELPLINVQRHRRRRALPFRRGRPSFASPRGRVSLAPIVTVASCTSSVSSATSSTIICACSAGSSSCCRAAASQRNNCALPLPPAHVAVRAHRHVGVQCAATRHKPLMQCTQLICLLQELPHFVVGEVAHTRCLVHAVFNAPLDFRHPAADLRGGGQAGQWRNALTLRGVPALCAPVPRERDRWTARVCVGTHRPAAWPAGTGSARCGEAGTRKDRRISSASRAAARTRAASPHCVPCPPLAGAMKCSAAGRVCTEISPLATSPDYPIQSRH